MGRLIQNGKIVRGRLDSDYVSAWRSRLFSIFVENVGDKVLKGALKSLFDKAGVVVDIYLSSIFNRQGTAFDFIKFRKESEMKESIRFGERKVLKGRMLRVIETIAGWSNWKSKTSKLMRVQKINEGRYQDGKADIH